jgi:hypothetical protein
MWIKLLYGMLLFISLHVMVWFSMNLQFVKAEFASKSIYIALALAIPTTMSGYYASRFTYEALNESAWAVRFVGFGLSYMVFPILTWWLLKESMFTAKTMICIALSVLILCIQIFWK